MSRSVSWQPFCNSVITFLYVCFKMSIEHLYGGSVTDIYFISHEEEMLLFGKSDHIFNALPALDLTYHTATKILGCLTATWENKA